MKKIIGGFGVLCFLVSCGSQNINQSAETQSTDLSVQQDVSTETLELNVQNIIQLSASIIPLSSVIHTVGGEYVEVENIIPAGVSPHGFDLSAKQMAALTQSEKVFMTGLEHIDGFLKKAVSEDKQVHLADGIELIETKGHEHEEHSDEEHSDKEHSDEEHSSDPHVWLGKDNIIQIALEVRDELSTILPEQAEYFAKNTETFISDIEAIYDDFEKQTDEKTPQEFIVFHDAYNYLMQSVGIDLNLKVPFSENVLHESGTAHLKELIEEVELHGITHVFREPQFQSTNLEDFASTYNLTLGILDPLGTNPQAGGYIENLESNLKNFMAIYE